MPQRTQAPDTVLRALADARRRDILRLVRDMELAAGQIAASFTLTQQAVSQHIAVLKQPGLLAESRDGTRRILARRIVSLEIRGRDGICRSVTSPT